MARSTKKTTASAAQGDQLSVPAAATEVAKAIMKVRSMQPDPPAGHDGASTAGAEAEAVPRSRSELRADIEAKRSELEGVLGELGGRLDVSHRVQTAVDDIRTDPVRGAKRHPKTVVAATAVVIGAAIGITAIIRAIAR